MQIEKTEIEEAIDEEISKLEKQYGKSIKFSIINIIGLIKMLNPENKKEKSRLIPLSKWNEYHAYPSVAALRQYYLYRESNGFDHCIEYGGNNQGRIYINENKYFEWHNNRNKFKK